MSLVTVNSPIPPSDITSIVEHNEELWIGTRLGHVVGLQTNPNSTTSPFLEPSRMPEPLQGCSVQGLYSISSPNMLIAHYYTAGGQPNRVRIMHSSKPPVDIVPVASLVAIAKVDKNPPIVIANGQKFSIYQFSGDQLGNPAVQETGSEILAISINTSAVAFYSGGQYRIFWLSNSTITDVTASYVQNPLIVPLNSVSFIFCLPGTMVISGNEGEKPSPPILYNKGITSIPNERPNYMYIYQEKLFEFFPAVMAYAQFKYKHQDNFTSKPIARVRMVCQKSDTLVFVTDTEMHIYGGTSKGTKLALLAIEKGIEPVVAQFIKFDREDKENSIIDMFKFLWEKDQHLLALQIVGRCLWTKDVREIISLFPMIILASPLENRTYLSGTRPLMNPEKSVMAAFGTFLVYTSSQYHESSEPELSSQLPIVDTSLFQFYAMYHQTRELDAFLQKPNSADMQLANQFFNQNLKPMRLHPALAIHYTRMGKYNEALSLWKDLNNADVKSTRWAKEASFTIRDVRNEDLFNNTLEWIRQRSIDAALNTFIYPQVDTFKANMWIQKNCPTYAIKFLDYIVKLTNPKPQIDLLDRACTEFCTILKQIESDTFDHTQLTFLDDVFTKKKSEFTDKVREKAMDEIVERVLYIIRTYGAGLSMKKYYPLIIETRHRSLLFEMFQIGEMYDQAMDIMFQKKPLNINELQDFCRNCPNPETAFTIAFSRMSSSGVDVVSDFADLLIANLEWVDCEKMIDWIHPDAPLSKLNKLMQATESVLIQKEKLLKAKFDIIQTLEVDSKYRLVKAHKRNCEIQHNTVCAHCQRPVGNGWLAIAPDNKVYHISCKPRLS